MRATLAQVRKPRYPYPGNPACWSGIAFRCPADAPRPAGLSFSYAGPGGTAVNRKTHPVPREFASLDRAGRNKVMRRSALHVCTVLAGLAVVYLAAPVSRPDWNSGWPVWPRLVAAVVVFVVVMLLQMQRILYAEVPEARAVEAVVVSISVFLVLFSLIYLSLSHADPQAFNEPLDKIDALYFTTATFATVGFGDVAALSQAARLTVTVQMLLDLVLIVAVAKVTFFVARSGVRRTAR